MSDWPVLSIHERRVLGVLVEKQKTTDTYPLTLNSLVTGSNQKSNRDPLMDLDDAQIEDIMVGVQKKGLVMRLIGGRVDKWRHQLYEEWNVKGVELAILAELLLRGPQTEGELRARASRMDDIADVDALRELLKPLAERKLVVYLSPEGRRGTVVTHGFHEPQELARIKERFANAGMESDSVAAIAAAPAPPVPKIDLTPIETRLNEAHAKIAALEGEVARLNAVVQHIQKELGISVPVL
jgi:uncharacterized protein YceH (UPF0502 family)